MVNEGLASLVFPLFLPLIAYVGLRGAKEMVPELSDGLRLTAFIAAPMICSFCVRSTIKVLYKYLVQTCVHEVLSKSVLANLPTNFFRRT